MINRIRNRHRYRSIFYSKNKLKKNQRKILHTDNEHIDKTIYIPKKISILQKDDRELLFSAVKKIHKKAKKYTEIYIDFSETTTVYSEGMLYLYAEIENLLNINKDITIKCKKSRTLKVNHVLYHIGLFKLCNHTFSPSRKYKDIIYWKKSSGVKVEGPKFDEIMGEDDRLKEVANRINIYGGFIEAIKNAYMHAYIKQRKLSHVDHQKTAWWVFSQVRDDFVSIAICDLGIGIPATVPSKFPSLIVELAKKIKLITDADIIKAAVERPSSRTGKSYRGNGLKTIAEIAKQDNRASFFIASSKGYVYSRKNQLKRANFKSSLPGTIVAWKLPLHEPPKDSLIESIKKLAEQIRSGKE